MKKVTFSKSALFALMSFAITACGSSGGGSSADQPSAANNLSADNAVVNQPSSTQDAQTSGATVANDNRTGGALVAYDKNADQNYDGEDVITYRTDINNANADTIVVEGVNIVVRRAGIKAGSWAIQRSGEMESYVCCGKYDDAYIGAYEGGPNSKYIQYYNGNPTDLNQIPQSGTATYTGDSFYQSSRELDEDFYTGSSALTADFGAKTLKGELSFNEIDTNVAIDANINGNNFAGSATSNGDADVAKVEGKFYGANAKELAGLAIADENIKSKEQGWSASFIATKPKSE